MHSRYAFQSILNAILDSGADADRRPQWIGGSLDDRAAQQVAKGYRLLWRLYPEVSPPVLYCRLDPATRSIRPSIEQWTTLAGQFVRAMGLPENTPWVAYRHDETPRGYIQILGSRVDFLGEIVGRPAPAEFAHIQSVIRSIARPSGLSLVPRINPPRRRPRQAAADRRS